MKLKPNCKVPRLNPKYLAKPCTIQVNRKCNMAATRGIPEKKSKRVISCWVHYGVNYSAEKR